jgi:hypothetical protein
MVLLMSCSTDPGSKVPTTHFLRVTRNSSVGPNHFPAFSRNINDSASVTRLYNAIQALPLMSGIYNCPADDGLQYQLAFSFSSSSKQQMILDAAGCQQISINQSTARLTNEAFWSLFAQTLGVPKSALFPPPYSTKAFLNAQKPVI